MGLRPRAAERTRAQRFSAAARGIPYVHSKHEAESEALRVAAHGLDVVIVNPTYVIGPDDPLGNSMVVLRRFVEGEIAAYVNGGINICDVRDVAAGMLLADEKGGGGERYILGGRNFTLQRLFADLARISGLPGAHREAARERPACRCGGRRAARAARCDLGRGGPRRGALVDLFAGEGEARARLQRAPP